jgi:hypothetical protein
VVPATSVFPAMQFVMNTIPQAWSRFLIPEINCARLFRNKFYFADHGGNVYLYGGVVRDGTESDGTGGTPISARMFTAFNYFEDPTTNKHFKMIRPIFQSTAEPSIYTQIAVDYDAQEPLPLPPLGAGILGEDLWDVAKWDIASWESSVQAAYHGWRTVFGMGFCAALGMVITAAAETRLIAVEWVFESGGSI